ncbi:YheU family protein [Aliikangiella maris]|uniref:YheU family protein n=2 Tax=Aliikangiella maris TaxID=3162458 RepID=A0ABV2BP10_9GAMM
MLIEYQQLSTDALYGIAKQYVEVNLSDVDTDIQLEDWIQQVINLVKKGELLIEFSQANESVYLKKPEEIYDESTIEKDE